MEEILLIEMRDNTVSCLFAQPASYPDLPELLWHDLQ